MRSRRSSTTPALRSRRPPTSPNHLLPPSRQAPVTRRLSRSARAVATQVTHYEGEDRGLAFHLRDLILGGQDGLVNVLGLVLGLTSAAAERDYYQAKLEQERREIREVPDAERAEVREIFEQRGLRGELLDKVVA